MPSTKALALIKVKFENGEEQTVEVSGTPFNIGRIEPNELVLPSPKVSRAHARLLFEGERIWLIDLQSANGILLGDKKLQPNHPYALDYGQHFKIGPYLLHVEPVSPPKAAAEPRSEIDRSKTTLPQPEETPPSLQPVNQDLTPTIAIHAGPEDKIPPPPPPGLPLSPASSQLPYDRAFGLPEDCSRYLAYLPPIYEDHPFLGGFLLAFEGILSPIEQMVDNFDLYLNPFTVPAYFLDHLAAWLDLTLDEKWPLEKRRQLVAEIVEIYRRRGTRWSLSRHLEIYTGLKPEILEPENHPHHFVVILRVPAGLKVDRSTVERIIRVNKPSHTTFRLEIRSS
jgi:phage tail-like protein